ncbi:MAG: DNA-binding response regulator [Chloroflexi bacterium]|nr:DNA-binding response regulator [Chloroflexota bacterium]MBV6438308.1 hypothetical protein [Anaerolineae bacterium]MDL1915240.1 response regulator transcription factor [Anaerolineae bacterium CFX4]
MAISYGAKPLASRPELTLGDQLTMRPIRAVSISTNAHTRSSIAQISLQSQMPLEWLEAFPDFDAAKEYLRQHAVQVILVEDSLPQHTTLLKEIKAIFLQELSAIIIVILQQPSINMVLRLVSCGVRGILYKHDNLKIHLVQAIVAGKRGGFHLSPGISRFIDGQRVLPVPLSPREYDVLRLLANGFEPKAIALHVGLGRPTVYRIIQFLRARFDAQNNAHLIAIAHQSGLLDTQGVEQENS